LASKPAHVREFEHSADLLARYFGHSVRVAAAAELRDEVGSERYHGGLIDEKSAGLNPARYVAGLARSAQAAGATLHDHTPVTAAARLEGRWQLSTGRGTLWATEVLVATSGYTGSVTPALRRRIVPVGSYVIATEPLAETVAHTVSPRGRMMYDSRRFLHYFRLTPDRRLLFGGRARFVPETASTVRESAEILGREMRQVFPQLADARIEYAWGGTLDFAFDTMPHAGTLDGWRYSLGYAGHGVALATLLGTRVAQSMVDADAPALPFSRIPFPGLPRVVYSGRPWFLPLVATWYRFLDVVG
jgi:glycine/D-amino acid oxidase-like deaminating enzyme